MSKKFSLQRVAVALAAGCLFQGAALADTATGTLTVTAAVISTCVVTPATLAFGTYALGVKDAEGSIVVTCTGDVTSYTVGLGQGTNGSSTTARKLAAAGGGQLNYQMFSNSGRTQNWGDSGAELAASSAGVGAGSAKTFTVYGRIPANQDVNGSGGGGVAYSDTVQISVNY